MREPDKRIALISENGCLSHLMPNWMSNWIPSHLQRDMGTGTRVYFMFETKYLIIKLGN